MSVILRTLTSLVGPKREGKQPPGSARNGTDLTERSESCNQSTEAGATLDPMSGIAHKIEKGREKTESVSCVCGKKGRKSEERKREEEHANYNQKPL